LSHHHVQTVQQFLIQRTDPTLAAGKCRLDVFLLAQDRLACSRSQIRKLIIEGAVSVNGAAAKPGYWIKVSDRIDVIVPALRALDVQAEEIALAIVFEDEHLLVIDKPAGMVVHPAPGHASGTLVHALLHHCAAELSGIGGVQRPGIVHRLDRETSGLMVVAKTDQAHLALSEQLQVRQVSREYWAVAHGRFQELNGTIDAPIGRHPKDRQKMAVDLLKGREAISRYRVLEALPDYTIVKMILQTGRTHQIRVHLKHIHHPIVGDPVYGSPAKNNFGLTRQALHAQTLRFLHPAHGRVMEFESPLPEDLQQLLEKLHRLAGKK